MEQKNVIIRPARITGTINIEIADEPGMTFKFQGDLPEEVQKMFERVLGNGQLRVSCSKDKSVKDFGTGVSASFTVSASCHESSPGEPGAEQDPFFHEASRLVLHYSGQYAQTAFLEAEAELKNMLQQRGRSDAYKF